MTARTVGLIWAQTPAGVIGRDNGIPWRVPEDVAHFRATTADHPVVMGRRTWDSLPARFRPLPGRRNIVVTRQPGWCAAGAESATSVPAALALAGTGTVWVIGGAEIYREALAAATDLAVTEVELAVEGDSFAPALGPEWAADDPAWQASSTGIRYRIRRYRRAER
ncbi:dihydrofolate reductase [Nocardia harenae]|uniref:dihydrofolate reductase n=1 Tax=Nocardia harenae TaxID=358707 RepID=UPI000837A5EB|nr:dihydrofolate reductase [Nocardia harenae]